MNLKNSQYQAIMRQYDLRQMEHRHQQTLRYEELCNKLPAYRDLEDQIAALYADRARAAVLGQAVQLQDMLQQIQTLQHQQRILMTRAGYPSDYLALTYTCPDCHDTGFIGDEKCHCFKQAMVDLLYRQSNIHEVLERENFDTFDIRYYSDAKNRNLGISPRENMQAVLNACHDLLTILMNRPAIFFFMETQVSARHF